MFCLLFLAQFTSADGIRPYKSRFSLKLTGGGSFAAIGDMNSHLQSIDNNDTFKYWRTHDPTSISGEIKTLNNWGYDFELELMMKFNPKFSIGLAASAPFHRRNESTVIFTQQEIPAVGFQKINMEYRPEIRLPFLIRLSFYYSWLSMTRFRANIMGGIGYYPVTLSEYIKEITHTHSIMGDSMALDITDWNAKEKYPFGFHGGIGMEYALSEEFSFVIDIQGRYIRFGNLRASGEFRQEAMTFRRSGVLYYLTYWHPVIEAKYDKLDISETEVGGENVRKAILDLSGFSLKVGIKVNLF